MKLEFFLSELGSKKGAPGGGAAAALTGALGAGLVEMVARINDARSGQSSNTARRAAVFREALRKLIAKDAKAFLRIQALCKTRKKNINSWQGALKTGVAVPFQICEACVAASDLAQAEKGRTSDWLQSDLKESRILLRAAFEAAGLNVGVNLKEITDDAFCVKTRGKMKKWRQRLQRS